jgi:ABC-2 type transport system ATP-binding protein
MWRRVLGGLPIAAVIAGALACAPAASAKDVTITSFDGTKIAAHWFPGKGVDAGSPAPTILEGPGWSSAGETEGGGVASGLGGIFGVPGISTFISHGYNVLTWDPRGFGQSGGTVEIDDPKYEARDVQTLIDWVAKQPEAQLDQSCSQTKSKRRTKNRKRRSKSKVTCATSPDDPTIGMAGASYGGGIQLVTAAMDKRIDAIAPTIAWHSLLTSLFPESNIKLGWGSILIAAGVEGSALPGGLSSPATAAGRQDPHFYSILANGLATGTTTQADLDWMAGHGPGDMVENIHVPTLIMQGTADTLFPLDEGVNNFQDIGDNTLRTAAIKAKAKRGKKRKKRKGSASAVQNVPVKMIWFCGGHGVCLTGAGPGSDYLDQRTVAWFDRYLRGRQDTDTGPKFAWIADDAQLRTSDAYPLKPAGQLHGSGSGTLPIVPGQGSGALIFATQSANAVNVPVPGPAADANVVGAPHLDLTYQGTAAPAKTWVHAQFVNPRSGNVLGNIATPIPLTLDGQSHSISRDLETVAGRAPAGGGYTLQLTASSSLYDIQRSTGAVTFDGINVTMPLGDPVTGASSPKAKHRKKHRKRKHRR